MKDLTLNHINNKFEKYKIHNMADLKLTDEEFESNTIHFFTNGTNEVIKFCNNGDIFVKGKLIENDKEVVDAMREFLKTQGIPVVVDSSVTISKQEYEALKRDSDNLSKVSFAM
jgi:hypothetical protein